MKKLTILLESIDIYTEKNRVEFKDYLLLLNGVVEVDNLYDTNNSVLTSTITYDNNIMKEGMLLLEIKTWLKKFRYPLIISFDKHFDGKVNKKEFIKNVCCEFCFKIAVEDLLLIDEIVKVDTNYIERYIDNAHEEKNNDILIIYYDASKFDSNKIDAIIKALNI